MTEYKLKKNFILAPSSLVAYGPRPFNENNKVSLGLTSSFIQGEVDFFRWGFNAGTAFHAQAGSIIQHTLDPETNRWLDVGFAANELETYSKLQLNNTVPRGTDNPRTFPRGPLAFSVGVFNDVGLYWPATVSDIFGETGWNVLDAPYNGLVEPFGTVGELVGRNENSITGSHATKQEFYISTADGPEQESLVRDGSRYSIIDQPSNPPWWNSAHSWSRMVTQFMHDKTYYDLSFTMNWPYPVQDMEKDSLHLAIPHMREEVVSIKSSYNFYVEQYESGTQAYDSEMDQNNQFPSYMLPSIYMFASELEESNRDPATSTTSGGRFWKHITLDGRIRDTFIDRMITIPNPSGGSTIRKVGEYDRGQHFEKFGNVLRDQSSELRLAFDSEEFKEYKNFIFPRSNLNLLEAHAGKEVLYPMHIKIEFTTDVNTTFSNYLRDSRLTANLIKWIIETSPDSYFDDWAQYGLADWCEPEEPGTDCDRPEKRQMLEDNFQNPEVYDFGVWADELSGLPGPGIPAWILGEFDDGTFLGKDSIEIQGTLDPAYTLFNQLMMAALKHNSKEFITDKFRTFKDLLRNNQGTIQGGRLPAYSETVLYCLEKTALNKETLGATNDVQKIWFPNSSDIDTLKYIDTQVKYNTPYKYVVKAYQLVIGNKTEYVQQAAAERPGGNYGTTAAETENDLWAKLCLFNTPCLKLIAVPIYDSSWDNPNGVMVEDTPPVPPDVRVIPYQGVDDKLLIWLNGNTGDFRETRIEIKDGEFGPNAGQTVRFKSDDPIDRFQIFKLDKRPLEFSDFRNAEIMNAMVTGQRSYIDKKIRPNKKYYYTFRSVDIHGKTSNPTAVYECELVKTDEFVHFLIRTIEMAQTSNFELYKPFKRFLHIKPAFQQTVLNEAALATKARTYDGEVFPNNVGLETRLNTPNFIDAQIFDTPQYSVWNTGKKYKIRLHSKKSGKKLDFNINFSYSDEIIVVGED